MCTIRAVRVYILPFFSNRGKKEGGERKGLIKEMGFHSQNFCSQYLLWCFIKRERGKKGLIKEMGFHSFLIVN